MMQQIASSPSVTAAGPSRIFTGVPCLHNETASFVVPPLHRWAETITGHQKRQVGLKPVTNQGDAPAEPQCLREDAKSWHLNLGEGRVQLYVFADGMGSRLPLETMKDRPHHLQLRVVRCAGVNSVLVKPLRVGEHRLSRRKVRQDNAPDDQD